MIVWCTEWNTATWQLSWHLGPQSNRCCCQVGDESNDPCGPKPCANRAMNGSMMLTILGPNVKQKPAESIVLPSKYFQISGSNRKKQPANVWHPPPKFNLPIPQKHHETYPVPRYTTMYRTWRAVAAPFSLFHPEVSIFSIFSTSGHSRLVAGPV